MTNRILVVGLVVAIAFTACQSPSDEETACKDYIAAVDDENGIRLADAVKRLADGYEASMKNNDIFDIAEQARALKPILQFLSRSETDGAKAIAEDQAATLYSACRDAYG
jgi:hypothetical protein